MVTVNAIMNSIIRLFIFISISGLVLLRVVTNHVFNVHVFPLAGNIEKNYCLLNS